MSMPKFSECVAQKFVFPLIPLLLKGEKNSLHFLHNKNMYSARLNVVYTGKR